MHIRLIIRLYRGVRFTRTKRNSADHRGRQLARRPSAESPPTRSKAGVRMRVDASSAVRVDDDAPLLVLDSVRAEHVRELDGAPLHSGLTVELHRRECVAVVAPSGRGKTSLLRQVAALDQLPAPGAMRLLDRPQHEWNPSDWRARVLYLAQAVPDRTSSSPRSTLREAILPLAAQRSWQRHLQLLQQEEQPTDAEARAEAYATRWGLPVAYTLYMEGGTKPHEKRINDAALSLSRPVTRIP